MLRNFGKSCRFGHPITHVTVPSVGAGDGASVGAGVGAGVGKMQSTSRTTRPPAELAPAIATKSLLAVEANPARTPLTAVVPSSAFAVDAPESDPVEESLWKSAIFAK